MATNPRIDIARYGNADQLNVAFHKSARWLTSMNGVDYEISKDGFVAFMVDSSQGPSAVYCKGMTSQIAIFNPLGVAVASDTVSTISTTGKTKTMNNAQKIFALHEPHLLVVIESGDALSNGIHMQLLINEWSRTLENAMPTVKEYAQSFAEWYSTTSDLIPKESDWDEVNWQLNDHYHRIKRRIKDDLTDATSQEEAIASTKFHTQSALESLKQFELFEGATDEDDATLLTELNIDLIEKINAIFQGISGLDEARETLIKCGQLALSRFHSTTADSDLGFIGFGQ